MTERLHFSDNIHNFIFQPLSPLKVTYFDFPSRLNYHLVATAIYAGMDQLPTNRPLHLSSLPTAPDFLQEFIQLPGKNRFMLNKPYPQGI